MEVIKNMNYLIKTKGLFVTSSSGVFASKPYELDFLLNINDKNLCLQVIRKSLLDDRLKERNENYRYFRTCEIVSISEANNKNNSELNDTELSKLMVDAITLNCVPQNITQYTTNDQKVKALKKALQMSKMRAKRKVNNQDSDE